MIQIIISVTYDTPAPSPIDMYANGVVCLSTCLLAAQTCMNEFVGC